MLLNYIYNRIENSETRENFVAGIAFGIAAGVAAGVVAGIVTGVVAGVVAGITFGIVKLISFDFNHLLFVLLLVLLVSELLYWLDRNRYVGLGRWSQTLVKKCESFFESSAVIVNGAYVVLNWDGIVGWFGSQGNTIHTVLCFVGYGTGVVLFIIGFVYLNSLKYREKKKHKRKVK